jgi:hypothetical protein
MRVKMLESLPVTVDGVTTLELEAGDEAEMGDGIAADLIDAGKAEPADPATVDPAETAAAHESGDEVDDEVAADEADLANKDAGAAAETKKRGKQK